MATLSRAVAMPFLKLVPPLEVISTGRSPSPGISAFAKPIAETSSDISRNGLRMGGRRTYRRTALLQSQKGFRDLLQATFVPGGGRQPVGSIRRQEPLRTA